MTNAVAVCRDMRHSSEHMSKMKHARYLSGNLGGRPTKYEPWMPRAAFEMLVTDQELYPLSYVAACLGIASSTLHDWRRDRIEFGSAISIGLAVQEYNAIKMLIRSPQGINVRGLIFALKNSAHRYKDKVEQKQKVLPHQELSEYICKAKIVDWDNPELAK